MEKFKIEKNIIKKVKRFNLTGHTIEFKIKPVPNDVEPVGWVKDGISDIIRYATTDLDPTDQVGFSFCSKHFEKGTGWVRFREASKINIDHVWDVLSGIFQSNSTGFNTDTFCLGVTTVKIPIGKGRCAKYNSFDEESRRRKGIVVINNNDNMCLPRALVVAIAHCLNDPNYKAVRQDIRKEQTTRTINLIANAGVPIPEEGCGIKELQLFQNYLTDFRITVYNYNNKGRDLIFKGFDAPQKINLLYHHGHFNVITSLTAAFACCYYCEDCDVPYNNKTDHRCMRKCISCQQMPPCIAECKIKCTDCNRSFKSRKCFDNHKRKNFLGGASLCDTIRICADCMKTVKSGRHHICGEIYCKICQKHQPQNHECYMKPDHGKPKLKDFLFIFYDLETSQEKALEDGSLLHVPNLCVFKTCCENCINSNEKTCGTCGERVQISSNNNHNFLKQNPIQWFMNFTLTRRQLFQTVTVIAHNGQSFDHQFLLNHVITKTDLTPELIMRGTKIIQMKLGNVKFVDSLNYFPMALAKLPKAFGLPDTFKKGYFPHLFNTEVNQNYIGPLPALEYYDPDAMFGSDDPDNNDERKEFLEWYDHHKQDEFNFRKELVEYCVSDVEILTLACLKFREQMLATSNVCPFTEACTIASTCNKVYRRNFLQPNTIGLIPKGGYRWRDNQSRIATQWLVWEEYERKIDIMHSAKGREVILGGVKVDGYCHETHQAFEFHGCYYHGHDVCHKTNRDAPLFDNPNETLNLRYESTIEKTSRLRELGYEVIEMWECSFRNNFSQEMRNYTETHHLVTSSPLNPRDAFLGGRTGNCKTYYECKPGEKIKYVDICSLYPYICKYGKYPIGHPEVIVGNDKCVDLNLNEIDGLIKCTILPPQQLFHPVLPSKMKGKLMFVLCRMCGETLNSDECSHNHHERALSGTWVIDEIRKAIEVGYSILNIDEVWKYKCERYNPALKLGGLFTKMMNAFIKIKQEASGWPTNCVTESEKSKYIDDFSNAEGIQLEFDKIAGNAGLRSLAKLILNSFWGKLGQRENQPKTAIVNRPDEFFNILSNPAISVNGILPINENVLIVNYEYIEEAHDLLSTVNVCLAAYTTAQARLKLYSYLEMLGDRVLYYDTDSVIYVSKETEENVPVGNFLGEMTDELEIYGCGSYITKFASGGPKNYAYEVYSTRSKSSKTVVKVKGIRLNYKTTKLINFEKISNMICNDSPPVKIVTKNIKRSKYHEVTTQEETKIYRLNSTKRKFDDNFDSVPYGYKKKKRLC